MPSTSSRRRAARRSGGAVGALGVLGALALTGLGAVPAGAADAGPGLVLGAITPGVGLEPGDVFGVPAPFTNTGGAALDKVWITYDLSHGLGAAAELPANCLQYVIRADDGSPATSVVQCEFDQAVAPGVVYAPMETVGLRALGSALHDRVGVLVSSYAPGPGDNTTPPVQGTAPAEPLVEVSGTPAPPGSAEHEDWDSATVDVTAHNTADLKVAGAHLKGKVGGTVTFEVGLTDAGPAWVYGDERHKLAHVRVTLPPGTTVTHAFCRKLGTRTYDCATATNWLYENSGNTFGFTLRIDKAVPGARGSVAITGGQRPFDHVKSDDTAPILLDVAGARPHATAPAPVSAGSPAASTTGGNAPAPEGQLAATGSDPALPLAAAAGALVLGAGTVLAAHRRTRGRG